MGKGAYSQHDQHESRLIQTSHIHGFPKSEFGEKMHLYEFAIPDMHEWPLSGGFDWRVVRQDEFESNIIKAFAQMNFQLSESLDAVQDKLNMRMAQHLGKRPPQAGEEWNLYSGTIDVQQAQPNSYIKSELGAIMPCFSNSGDITGVNGCQWKDFSDPSRVPNTPYDHWLLDAIQNAYSDTFHARFPFTGMGYTFDWGKPNQPVGDKFTDYVGTTEFNILWPSGPRQWGRLEWGQHESSLEFVCRVCIGDCGSLENYLSNTNACGSTTSTTTPSRDPECRLKGESACNSADFCTWSPPGSTQNGYCSEKIPGCTDRVAINYNRLATEDDGTCKYVGEPQNSQNRAIDEEKPSVLVV